MPENHFDVLVVGGGLVGAATARKLAQAGLKVALLERTRLGDGASSRNIGFVWVHGRSGTALEIAQANRVLLDDFYEECEGAFEYRRNGGVILCETEGQVPLFEEFVKARHGDGLDVHFLDRATVSDLVPDAVESVQGGSYCADDAQIGTGTLVRALAGAARNAGAEIFELTEVSELVVVDGRVRGVRTHDRTFEASTVVWACGPWASIPTSNGALRLPVKSMRNQLFATTPDLPRLKTVVYGAASLMAYPHLVAHLPSYSDELFDRSHTKAGEGMMDAMSQRSDGAYIYGGPVDTAEFDWSTDIDGLSRTMRRFSALFPRLSKLGLGAVWAGRIPYTADGLPVIDRYEVDGLVLATGFTFGNSSCLIGAAVVGDLVLDRTDSSFTDTLSARRPTIAQDFSYSLG